MSDTISDYMVLKQGDGLRLQSGPGRDLIFKVTGEDTGGALDYFIVQVAPHGGPPLHVHHFQEETIQVLKGRYKIRIGDEIFIVNEGGFAYLPSKVPHAFLNLTDEPGEVIVVYTPGGGVFSRFARDAVEGDRVSRPDHRLHLRVRERDRRRGGAAATDLEIPVEPAVGDRLVAGRGALHEILAVEMRPRRVGAARRVDERELAALVERQEGGEGRVQPEEAVER